MKMKMKMIIISICLILLGCLIAHCIEPRQEQEPIIVVEESPIPNEYLGEFTLSFYNLNKNRTSQGTEVREGHTVACDTKVIPANSYIYIEGYGVRQCVDTGANIKGKRLDIYMNKSTQDLLKLGIQKRKVYLIIKK